MSTSSSSNFGSSRAGGTPMHFLQTSILPALVVAKVGVTGLGVPGVEPVINAVLELLTMISTMQGNKDDLSELEKSLTSLIALDIPGPSGDLQDRITKLTTNLKDVAAECKSLSEKTGLKRFLRSKIYKERIQNVKNSIADHIRDFTFHGNISIENSVQAIAESVEAIQLKVDNVLTNEILASLRCIPARYNAENTPDKCMTGTRVEIIKDIVQRLTDTTSSSPRIIMLSGSAGSGKSTIAKTVASILAEQKGILAASFFFSRSYADRRELRQVPSTIARQLADSDPQFRYLLVQFLDSDRTGLLSAEPHLQFQKLVVEILGKLPPSPKPWVICIDALDECGRDRGQVFLRWLSDSITQIPTYIRFFLTGRPDVPSYLKFATLKSLIHGISLDEIDSTVVASDIRLYIKTSLDGSTWTTRDPWKIQTSDVETMTTHADGLFVFAATAVRYVLAGLPQNRPQKSVDYLLKGASLTHLHDLYQLIVNEALPLPEPDDLRAQDARDLGIHVLNTILVLFEPLGLQALAALLNIDGEDLGRILVPLSAVIRVPDMPGGN
ncbi:WD-REPEATS-REGION domain-containing protein [Mycena venus]|uniref:WD-REPEATS-REGION domain-containing protein n=1 Tax=Mycena venus TaxID=2733690 RepID=A0A8H6XL33_9AGAR|nr:WD-REPEATS-REGION domain-containing protein [Mycena venus]